MKHLVALLCLVPLCFSAVAQDRNNEDEVVKLDAQFSRFNAVAGEVLVKFTDHSNLNMQLTRSNAFVTSGIAAVDNVLNAF